MKDKDHPLGPCGNVGCRKCNPSQNRRYIRGFNQIDQLVRRAA